MNIDNQVIPSLQGDLGAIKVIPDWLYQRFNSNNQIPLHTTRLNSRNSYANDVKEESLDSLVSQQ